MCRHTRPPTIKCCILSPCYIQINTRVICHKYFPPKVSTIKRKLSMHTLLYYGVHFIIASTEPYCLIKITLMFKTVWLSSYILQTCHSLVNTSFLDGNFRVSYYYSITIFTFLCNKIMCYHSLIVRLLQ